MSNLWFPRRDPLPVHSHSDSSFTKKSSWVLSARKHPQPDTRTKPPCRYGLSCALAIICVCFGGGTCFVGFERKASFFNICFWGGAYFVGFRGKARRSQPFWIFSEFETSPIHDTFAIRGTCFTWPDPGLTGTPVFSSPLFWLPTETGHPFCPLFSRGTFQCRSWQGSLFLKKPPQTTGKQRSVEQKAG